MPIYMLQTTEDRESYTGDWHEEVVHADLGYFPTKTDAAIAAVRINKTLVAGYDDRRAEYERQRAIYRQDEQRAARSGFRTLLTRPSLPWEPVLYTVIEIKEG